MLGYSKGGASYRLLKIGTNKIAYRCDFHFDELSFELSQCDDKESSSSEVSVTKATSNKEVTEEDKSSQIIKPISEQSTISSSKPVRNKVPPKRWVFAEADVIESAFSASEIAIPVNMNQAMASEQSEDWKKVATSEFNSLIEHETWSLSELPPDRKVVGSK